MELEPQSSNADSQPIEVTQEPGFVETTAEVNEETKETQQETPQLPQNEYGKRDFWDARFRE